MAGILPLTILLALYAVSEIISRKTHALVNTVNHLRLRPPWLLDASAPEGPLYQQWGRGVWDGHCRHHADRAWDYD